MLVLRHPAYQLDDDDKVVIGGTFRANLDAGWYTKECKLAAKYGVDALLFIAFSLVEYGGYRLGADHNLNIADRGLARISTGRKFVSEYGASGVQLGDAIHSGVLTEQVVQLQLQKAGAKLVPKAGAYWFDPQTSTQEQLDQQSFILLKRLQDTALQAQNREYFWRGPRLRYRTSPEPSIAFGLQSLHGYGQLPYLYRDGQFGDGKLMRYSRGRLVPGSAGNTNIRGSEHPIYGYSLAWFMNEMYKNPEIRRMLPPNGNQQVTMAVRRDFAKTKVRGIRPAH